MIPRGIYRNHSTGSVSPFILLASLRYGLWKGYRKVSKNNPQAKIAVAIRINGSPAVSSPCTSNKLFISPDPYNTEKPKKNSTGAAMILIPNFPIASADSILPGPAEEMTAKILNTVIPRLTNVIMKFEAITRNETEIKVNVSRIMILVKLLS